MSRAARWDGVLVSLRGREEPPTPDDVREIVAWLRAHRDGDAPFDVILEGVSPGDDPDAARAQLQPYADAGVTWWIESRWEAPNDVETLRQRIRQGPPPV